MRTVIVLIAASLAVQPLARSQQPETCSAPAQCGCDTPSVAPEALVPPADAPLRLDPGELVRTEVMREAKQGLAVGLTLFAAGALISAAHAATAHSAVATYDLVPLSGPAIDVFTVGAGTGWNSALLFATWLETAGVLAVAVSAAYMHSYAPSEQRVSVGMSATPQGGSIGVTGHF
jgi:hypothetical protein